MRALPPSLAQVPSVASFAVSALASVYQKILKDLVGGGAIVLVKRYDSPVFIADG